MKTTDSRTAVSPSSRATRNGRRRRSRHTRRAAHVGVWRLPISTGSNSPDEVLASSDAQSAIMVPQLCLPTPPRRAVDASRFPGPAVLADAEASER